MDAQQELQERAAQYKASVEKLSQMAASQDTEIKELRNELGYLKTQQKSLGEKLSLYLAMISDLKADKEALQKQLELIVLRLPASKPG